MVNLQNIHNGESVKMKYSDLVSVIIPVYNAGETIRRCLNSVVNQSYTNIEIIVIDDGSIDNSFEICKSYCAKDERIKVLKQNNSGPGAARNLGIEYSRGKYILFVDSDDYIANDMVEKMLKEIMENEAQVSICGYYLEKSDGQKLLHKFNIYPGLYEGDNWNNIALKLLDDMSPTRIPPYSWMRMIKRDVLENPKLRYTLGITRSEDYLFSSELNFRVNKVVLMLDQPLYYYVENKNSITRRYIGGYWEMVKNIYSILSEKLPKKKTVFLKLNIMLIQRALIAFHNAAMSGNSTVVDYEIRKILSDDMFISAIRCIGVKEGVRKFGFFYFMVLLNMKKSIIHHFQNEIKAGN